LDSLLDPFTGSRVESAESRDSTDSLTIHSRVLTEGAVLDGKYEIRGRLGGGGMGEVYLARRTYLGDEVAVKVVRPAGANPEVWRSRFLRESRACAQLRHPNIVSILDYSVDEQGQPYLVMEYLNGPSLAEELRARGMFDLPSVERMFRPLAAAIELAHGSGIVHRDLKPQNIVGHRFATGEVVHKIIDFGLANMRAAADETSLTQAHEFLGTVSYAAPEQFSGGAVGPAADQYCLGVIVYELLTGRRPIDGDGFIEIVDRHLNAAPVPIAECRPELPPRASEAVMRALSKTPEARWPSVTAFVRALGDGDEEVTRLIPAPAASSLLGIYELGPVIAKGRFGSAVHAGTHRALGHPVAIRTFRHPGDARDAVRERFLREARALQVPHPNIVQVRDFGEDRDTVYVVTDLLSGCSLAELLAEEGLLSESRLSAFFLQIADATAALHRRDGLICGLHPAIIRVVRDDDGERIAISSAGVCQIQDVLSTANEATLRGEATEDVELLYVAPELLLGSAATERSDVYTIGVLGYQMATGRTPYHAKSLPALIGAVVQSTPVDPRTLRPELSPAHAACLMRCLAREPGDRFPSVEALMAAWSDEAVEERLPS
jgi:serine/threonine protein kinase